MTNPVALEVDAVQLPDGLALAAPCGVAARRGALAMNGSPEDGLPVTADSFLLFMGGFSPASGMGRPGRS